MRRWGELGNHGVASFVSGYTFTDIYSFTDVVSCLDDDSGGLLSTGIIGIASPLPPTSVAAPAPPPS